MGYFKAALAFLGNLFGWLNKRSDLANSPEMIARRKAQDEQTQKDKGSAQISCAAKGDPKAINDLRADLSE